jgi:hypothetical protein
MLLGIILTSGLILGILILYFMYITTPKKGRVASNNQSGLNASEVRAKWGEVQAMMKAGGPANYKQSIMEADKLVDVVLKSRARGETMGERLKNARNLFSRETYDALWTAHKIRNRLAHEADFEGLSSEARLAVRNFEKALHELRVL